MLVPVLVRARLHFKYVKDLPVLQELNAGRHGYTQVGKAFVIYLPRGESQFIKTLMELLSPYRGECPAVPCARPFGGGLPLYYRYGAFTGRRIFVRGSWVKDDRLHADLAVPPGVRDVLFRHTTPEESPPEERSFLLRYPVFAAMAQAGKGGVFQALNVASETYQEVVLKVGYQRGQIQMDGSDGCTLLRRELTFYRLLAEHGMAAVAPRLIDSLDRGERVMAVMEYVEGGNLAGLKLRRRLSIEHLERSWAILGRIHRRGLFLGDAKLGNFLATGAGDVRVIDFESAGVIGQSLPGGRTFRIPDVATDDVRLQDRLHFLASVLYSYRKRAGGREDLVVPLGPFLHRAPRSHVEAWAFERLRVARASLDARG